MVQAALARSLDIETTTRSTLPITTHFVETHAMRANRPYPSAQSTQQEMPPESPPYVVDSEGHCYTSRQAQLREEQGLAGRRLPGSDDEESE